MADWVELVTASSDGVSGVTITPTRPEALLART